MDGARVRLANTGTRRGREVVQVYASRPGQRDRAPAALARGLRRRRGRRRRGGHRRRPALPARVPALGRRLADRAGRVRARGGPLASRTCDCRGRRGAEAARVLRGGRAPPALHARGRGALRHPAGALAAGPAARGGARARRCCGARRSGVELTAAGEDLLVHAEKVLAEVAAARADMDRHTGVSRGVVRVAATAADAPRLPEALADFHGDHPGIQIALRQGSAAEVVALVAARRGRRRACSR